MRKSAIALTTIAGVFAGSATANAQDAEGLFIDDRMRTVEVVISRYFNSNNNVLTTKSAMGDFAVGVYCEYTVKATDDSNSSEQLSVDVKGSCKDMEMYDVNQWYHSSSPLWYKSAKKHVITDPASNIVIEYSKQQNEKTDIIQLYIRSWNFATGKVCLRDQEGHKDKPPYYDNSFGCYDIPKSDYAVKIQQLLQPE